MRRTIIITLALLLLTVSGWAQPRPGSFTTLRASSILATALGSATAPFISVTSDTNTGIYWTGSDALGVTIDGTLRTTWSTTAATFTYPLYLGDGSSSVPPYTFSADTNTGIYRHAADTLGFAVGGNLVFTISSTGLGIASGYVVNFPNGSAASPSLLFGTDADTGAYVIGEYLYFGRDLNNPPTSASTFYQRGATPQIAFYMGDGSSAASTPFYLRYQRAVVGAGVTLEVGASLLANLGAPANGSMQYCSDCLIGSTPCTGSSTGAMATRINGAWRCL